jgi:hypothetical protein
VLIVDCRLRISLTPRGGWVFAPEGWSLWGQSI